MESLRSALIIGVYRRGILELLLLLRAKVVVTKREALWRRFACVEHGPARLNCAMMIKMAVRPSERDVGRQMECVSGISMSTSGLLTHMRDLVFVSLAHSASRYLVEGKRE